MPRIKVAGELIYFEDRGHTGSGGALLLIHGAGGSSRQWQDVLEILEKDHRVIALDLPGHGNSSGRGSRSIGSYLKVVRAFIETLNLPNFLLCGHSMGGAIAMEYARTYPKDTCALALIATGARLRVAPIFLDTCLEGDMDKLQVLTAKYAFSPAFSLVQIQKWQKKWGFPLREVVYGDFLACNSFDCLEEVEKIEAPTLIICGEEDRMTPVKYSQYLNSKIKGSSLEVISTGGHMLMVETPKELSRLLTAFAGNLCL